MTYLPETILIPKRGMPVMVIAGFLGSGKTTLVYKVLEKSDRPLSLHKFQNFLDNLPPEVFRAKGLLWFSESPNKYVFQLSGKRCTLDVEPWNSAPHANQLMFIGRNLDAEQIRRNLVACQNVEAF